MRDVMCSGYVAGANTGFFGAKGDKANAASLKGPVSSEAVKLDMSSRLSFDDEERGEYQSMLAFACGYGDGAKRDQVISITDRLLPWEVHGSDTAKTYFPGGPENYMAYRKAWELHTLHFGEDVRAAENMEFISQGSSNNGLCFIGPHRKYNPYSNLYHELIPGQGHFGPDAIPGVKSHALKPNTLSFFVCSLTPLLTLWQDARWRRGEAVSLKASRDSMVSLEVAAHSQMYLTKAP